MAKAILGRLFRGLKKMVSPSPHADTRDYWNQRAKAYGRRSVLNISHTDEEYDAVTKMQHAEIFPHLEQQLNGHEQVLLDFGCGPGRFCGSLAKRIDGKVIGVDPTAELIEIAEPAAGVEYRVMEGRDIPLGNDSVDVVWICLVLGGIVDTDDLNYAVSEIERVLKPGGLLLVVENTTDKPGNERWVCRPVRFYQELFGAVKLTHLSDYTDSGEQNSILAGRSHV